MTIKLARAQTTARRLKRGAGLRRSVAKQPCVRYHAVRGRLSAHLLLGCARKKSRSQDKARRAVRRLQTPLAKTMMRAMVPRSHSVPSLPCAVARGRAASATARVLVRPLQAALGRSGGEHPTLVAVYVERGSVHAAGLQSQTDRHPRGAVPAQFLHVARQTQTSSHRSLLHAYSSAPILKTPPPSYLFSRRLAFVAPYFVSLQKSQYSPAHHQSTRTRTGECSETGFVVIFWILSLITSCLAPVPESLAGGTTHLCWTSSTCGCSHCTDKRGRHGF